MINKFDNSFKLNEEQLAALKQIIPEAFKDGFVDIGALSDALSDLSGDYILDIDDNLFGLYWPGKRAAKRAAAVPPLRTLVPVPGDGVDEETTRNIYIEGDNLEVLKIIKKAYTGKIKMIYIDPPYNTGNDFIYNDDFSEAEESYKKQTGQVDESGVAMTTNKKADGRFHSKWCSMMYPRLRIARELLSDDGVIFISIDDNEVAQLRKMCDEIFGEDNFRNQIVARRGAKSVQAQFDIWDKLGQDIEYILLYTKDSDYRFPQQRKKLEEKRQGTWNNHWRGTDRPTMRYELFGIIPKSGQWRWGKDRSMRAIENYNKMLSELNITEDAITQEQIDIYYTNLSEEIDLLRMSKNEKPEHYIAPTDSTLLNSSWYDLLIGSSSEISELFINKVFETAKLTTVIERMLNFCKRDAIILDFFSGSATTAHAVMQLNAEDGGNRQFIMVQLQEEVTQKNNKEAYNFLNSEGKVLNICEIGKERIRRAGKKIKEEAKSNAANLDTGFKVFRLAPSSIKPAKPYTGTNIKELPDWFAGDLLVEGWKTENLITEVMLKEGFPLDSAITTLDIYKKNKVYQVSSDSCDHSLIICFDKNIESDTVEKLNLGELDTFICLDSAITDQVKARLDDKEGRLITI